MLIRQIAALPYRTSGPASDAPVDILMVTSRETRRWVIPKGNVMRSVAPHHAAAIEAEEEAGVRGAVGPAPIGSYRYCKKRRGGASLMLNVDVFPLAVTEELDSWKEQGERERRWFSLEDAALAVEEEDLAALIRGFDPGRYNGAAASPGG
jgi:8-oxo-dGTP pyrophosphatase MutT (NUDIX family)